MRAGLILPRVLLVGVGLLALGACVSETPLVQEASRGLARSAVNTATAEHLPGVSVAPFTDCVINNAGTGELMSLASAAAQGSNGASAAWPVVRDVVKRPATTECLVQALSASDLIRMGAVAL